jgi:hypothetical protein
MAFRENDLINFVLLPTHFYNVIMAKSEDKEISLFYCLFYLMPRLLRAAEYLAALERCSE